MKSIIASVIFLVSHLVFAQNKSEFPFLSGSQNCILTFNEGDTAVGEIKLTELPSFVSFKKQGSNKFSKKHISGIKKVQIDTLEFVTIIYRPNELTSKNSSLVLQLQNGKIELYRFFSFKKIGRKTEFFTTLVLKKEGVKTTDLSNPSFISFKSGIEPFIRDNKELLSKVEKSLPGYSKQEIEKIIYDYNHVFEIPIDQVKIDFELELQRRLEIEKERIINLMREESK